MKHLIYIILLTAIYISPVWSAPDTDTQDSSNKDVAIEVTVDDDEATTAEFETRLQNKIISFIEHLLDEVENGLSEEQKEEIIDDLLEEMVNDNDHDYDDQGFLSSVAQIVVPSLAIIFIFGTPIMIVAAILYFSYRKRRLMHDTINQYVSSGKDIPPEVLSNLRAESSTPKSNLHKGLVMCGIGLGIFACFSLLVSMEVASIGLIPLFIGLAQLLIWKLEQKGKTSTD